MIKNKYIKLSTIAVYLIAAIILYTMFLVMDAKTATNTIYIKYSVVIISTAFTLISLLFINGKQNIIQVTIRFLALILTLVADYFLLVTSTNFIVGVSVFLVAQLCHALSLQFINGFHKIEFFIIVSLRIAISTVLAFIFAKQGPLFILAAIYFTQLVMNFVESLIIFIETKNTTSLLLTIGFFLFIGCDVFVGLFNLLGEEYLYSIWLFYAPSQVLIGLSSYFINSSK